MEFFSGTVEHQLDGKNRIRIPAKFRAKLGENYFLMARPNGCIGVYPKESLEAMIEKMGGITTGDPDRLKAKRKVLSTIDEPTEDGQGRLVLSQFFRNHAHIGKEIVTIGMGDFLEIWSKEEYAKYDEDMNFDEACRLLDF